MYNGQTVTAVIVAAGTGSRMGSAVPKQFLKTGGRTILERAVEPFEKSSVTDDVLVVCGRDFIPVCRQICGRFAKVTGFITGGETRQDSVNNALGHVKDGYVLIHDGARPYVTEDVIERVLDATAAAGAAVCAVPAKDTIRRVFPGGGSVTLKRDELFCVQTPQGFRTDVIREAYRRAYAEGFYGTDDASLAERAGYSIAVAEGSYANIKITTKEDLPVEMRIGSGYDVHRLEEGRKLILCGTEIPFEKGILGHSDADVALHALMDAMLGAAAAGDIGRHFPDTDDRFKGVSSMELLKQTLMVINKEGYAPGNVDITIIAQRPKLQPYIEQMRENTAAALNIGKESVSVKATTTEKLGFTGRGEGIAAQAVCILTRI